MYVLLDMDGYKLPYLLCCFGKASWLSKDLVPSPARALYQAESYGGALPGITIFLWVEPIVLYVPGRNSY